jgi:succinate-semialdehyde dehydrogenase
MALKWRHAGQACITANRVYVHKAIADTFAARLAARVQQDLHVGHGAAPGTTMGPLTTARGLDKARAHVADAKALGARVVCGGDAAVALPGFFFQPTVILDAKPHMLLSREEIFAPVVALYEFETEEEAVRAANDTSV